MPEYMRFCLCFLKKVLYTHEQGWKTGEITLHAEGSRFITSGSTIWFVTRRNSFFRSRYRVALFRVTMLFRRDKYRQISCKQLLLSLILLFINRNNGFAVFRDGKKA